jgi:hypothetical protein
MHTYFQRQINKNGGVGRTRDQDDGTKGKEKCVEGLYAVLVIACCFIKKKIMK